MRYLSKHCKLRAIAALTLILALCLGTATPAQASFMDWLLGKEEPATPAAADAQLTVAPTSAPPTPGVDAQAGTGVTLAPRLTLETDVTPEPTVAPTAIPAASIVDDGLIRVYLKSLGDPVRLDLVFAGVYAVDGTPAIRFERNTQVTLAAGNGRVYMAAGPLTLDLGPAVTFTRHAAEAGGENGLYIEQAKKRNLYLGDLTVSAGADGLVPVLQIHVEDYLYGVVAYEMSDNFPIEALKAQAVAARTYAMQRKRAAGDRGYDLVDTTADQVFHGYDSRYGNVIAAVDATRGVVGVDGQDFATCYYTASNGGQTALASQAWGKTDSDGYLAMKDDPYDLENPRSLQNDVTVSPLCEGSETLKAMLTEALRAPMTRMGYAAGEWRMDSIDSIIPSKPKAPGSRWYEGLDFTLNVSVQVAVATPRPTAAPTPEPTATPSASATSEVAATPTATPVPSPTPASRKIWLTLDKPVTVTLDVYEQIKTGLGLGLNKANYELISVETATNGAGEPERFKLIMRRFGHGVGMSQRGAQWMAGHYGMDYGEILTFYYPGLSFQRMDWPETALTALPALPVNGAAAEPTPTPSPTPTPAPLPSPEAGERLARVALESNDSALNVRETANINARVLATLAAGREVLVRGEADDDGWIAIRTAEFSGFVKAEYLEDPAN